MDNLSLKQKIIGGLVTIGILLIAIFQMGLGGSFTKVDTTSSAVVSESADPVVISTNPEGLKNKENVTIVPSQVIEFTFNRPLENIPETRITLEPTADIKVELSSDKKTVKITPTKGFALGQGYTLFFKGNTKFAGDKQLGNDTDFHFTTISYNGV